MIKKKYPANKPEFKKIVNFMVSQSGPARGFGYTVSRAILIPVYGIFWSKFGYKVFSFYSILGIRYMVRKSLRNV